MTIDPAKIKWVAFGLEDQVDQVLPLDAEVRALIARKAGGLAPATSPLPTSPLPTPPGLPPIDYRRSTQTPRPDGVVVTRDTRLENVCLDGYRQGIDHRFGRLDLVNARVINCLRNDLKSELTMGNACYSGPNAGPATHTQCLFAYNGWQEGVPLAWKTQYCHNWYQDVGAGPLTSIDSIYAAPSYANVQLRGGGLLLRPIFLRGVVGLLAVKGPVRVEDGLFFDTDLADMNGGVMDGGVGVAAWTEKVELVRCTFVRRAGPWPTRACPKCYPSAIQINAHHAKNPSGEGAVQATDCRILSWPGTPFGLIKSLPGFSIENRPPVDFDWRPTIDAVIRNEISVFDAAAAIRKAVLG